MSAREPTPGVDNPTSGFSAVVRPQLNVLVLPSLAMDSSVPKVIWSLWLEGWDRAPSVVEACMRTWRLHNPDWTLRLLSRAECQSLLLGDPALELILNRQISAQAVSDIVRVSLLRRYGGVWVDATTYCVESLSHWLPSVPFFAFSNPGPNRPIATWFLAASPDSLVVRTLYAKTLAYWENRTTEHTYFWLNSLFQEALEADPEFRAQWRRTPEISARLPHYFLPHDSNLTRSVHAVDRMLVENSGTPILKLAHDPPAGAAVEGTVLSWLMERANTSNVDLTPRTMVADDVTATGRILVAWYGSFAGHGTVGDLLATQAVTNHLALIGFDFVHASETTDQGIRGTRVTIGEVDPDDIDTLVFVCGPILADHPLFVELLERFRGAKKVGVGVSVLPEGHPRHLQPFDRVLAREGQPEQFFDVAAASPYLSLPIGSTVEAKTTTTIGVCLRGKQTEYGPESSLHEEADALISGALHRLEGDQAFNVVEIENGLASSGLAPDELLSRYRQCDLILTTRYHGTVLSILSGVPVVVLDQIAGGAKVSTLGAKTSWPYVYRVDTSSVDAIASAARALLRGADATLLQRSARVVREGAFETLLSFDDTLRNVAPSHETGGPPDG